MPKATTMLNDHPEEELIKIIESIFPGRDHHRNFLNILKNSNSAYRGDLLGTARMLLDKDWILAGLFFENLPEATECIGPGNIRKWAGVGVKIFDQDKDLAIDYFSHSVFLLKDLDLTELEEWALNGINIFEEDPSSGRSYFSLKSELSRNFVEDIKGSVVLNGVVNVLRYYALGLSGVNFNILSQRLLQAGEKYEGINPVIAGKTIYLEPHIRKYGSYEDSFKVYKLSIMHEVGHVHFSSSEIDRNDATELMTAIRRRYTTIKKRTFLSGMKTGKNIDIADIIALFPNQALAGTILGILEDARVEYLVMERYRGVRADLERIRYQMLQSRPAPKAYLEGFMESLLWISIGYEPFCNIDKVTKGLLEQIKNQLKNSIFREESSILDSLGMTFRIYTMLDEQLGPLSQKDYEGFKNIDYRGVNIGTNDRKDSLSCESPVNIVRKFIPESEVEITENNENTDISRKSNSTYAEKKNWKILGSYRYAEWDVLISDYKADWCTVNEVEPFGMSSDYYKEASEQYKHEISQIRNVFSRMRPEAFRRVKEQIDGTEIDIDAFIDALIQKKCGINPDDGLYLRWDKKERDVATLFLIDVSYSTHKMIGYEGKSILDVEKDSLIIMTQALEAIGDKYAIHAFSGQTRDDVEYFTIKDFDEEISDDVKRRISVLEPVSNTRLGPAIRHSIKKFDRVNAKTKIIILLSDGEPFDSSRAEGAYKENMAEEDTRMAIMEGKSRGIDLFCITVDSNPGKYLDNIFSDAGYTIIDDANLLPETLPVLYKRITT